MTLPQLRVRTEFSFKEGRGVVAFGPLPTIVERLAEIGCTAAGMVDVSTWGHVEWAKACDGAKIAPLFGVALDVPTADGRKPVAWALAKDLKALNRFSTAARVEGVDRLELFRGAEAGVIRFSGPALTDPETFDYIDVNPASQRATMKALALAKATGKPLVVTSDVAYPAPRHRSAFLALGGREAVTPQHILSIDELRAALPQLSAAQFDEAVQNAHLIAEACAHKLPSAPLIHVDGDLRAEVAAGIQDRISRGHIPNWTEEYQARIERELAMIEQKKFESYFLVVADLIRWAKTKMLVGPGRGSSAGSLVCYVLRITEVDPLVHHLLFERFIDVTRADLPDIDIDFADTKRDMVFDYLAEKYGRKHVARLGNINTLKPRSAINEVGKRLGIPGSDTFDLANVLIEYSSGDSRYGKGLEDTMEGTAPGRAFIAKHPAAKVMTEIEGHASHTGIHAAGVVVCNDPISDYATVGPDGVAHVDKPAAESLNLLKIDALGLRTLGVMEDAGVADSETLYALTLDDPEVFRIFNERKYSGIFQFEGATQRGVSQAIDVNSFRRIDHVTALARPGPLGGGASKHYIDRAAGREEVTYQHPSMAPYLEQTLGVILYQEQVMRIVREIGQFSWEETTIIRKAMSGRKGKEFFDAQGAKFVAGAAKSFGLSPEDAHVIWDAINNFGAWGMNASHTVSYGVISYWCGWFKRYYPLEYAAACLRGAKDDDQAMEVLREMVAEGVRYTPFDIERSEVTWAVKDGELIGGFQNVRGVGAIGAAKYAEMRAAAHRAEEWLRDPTGTDAPEGVAEDAETEAKRLASIEALRSAHLGAIEAWRKAAEKIAKLPVNFADLRPAHTKWGQFYDDPASANVDGVVHEFATIPDTDSRRATFVVIGLVKKRTRRDRNESILIKRRGGERFEGQSLFLDIYVVDDSVAKPVIARIGEKMWDDVGSKLADRLLDDEDWLLMRGRWLKEFNMMLVQKVKCLNRPEILE